MLHTMETCPVTGLADDGFQLWHLTDDCAGKWTEETAKKQLCRDIVHVDRDQKLSIPCSAPFGASYPEACNGPTVQPVLNDS